MTWVPIPAPMHKEKIVVKIMLVATSVGQKNRRDKFDEWGKEDKKIVLLVS